MDSKIFSAAIVFTIIATSVFGFDDVASTHCKHKSHVTNGPGFGSFYTTLSMPFGVVGGEVVAPGQAIAFEGTNQSVVGKAFTFTPGPASTTFDIIQGGSYLISFGASMAGNSIPPAPFPAAAAIGLAVNSNIIPGSVIVTPGIGTPLNSLIANTLILHLTSHSILQLVNAGNAPLTLFTQPFAFAGATGVTAYITIELLKADP